MASIELNPIEVHLDVMEWEIHIVDVESTNLQQLGGVIMIIP